MSPVVVTCDHVVVDRVEESVAAVEWCGRFVSDVPVELLPVGAAEGAVYALRFVPAFGPPPVPAHGARGGAVRRTRGRDDPKEDKT
jgi:hypothetical protein